MRTARNPFIPYAEQQKQLRAIMADDVSNVHIGSKETLANSKHLHPGIRAFMGPRICKRPACGATVVRTASRGRQPAYCTPRCQQQARYDTRRALKLIQAALQRGIIRGSGAWLIFGPDNLGTSVESAAVYVQKHPDLEQDIRTALRDPGGEDPRRLQTTI